MKRNCVELYDKNYELIYLGQSVELFGIEGKIVFECGSFGIGFKDCINYDLLQIKMDNIENCCGNTWSGCFNNNFVSLWELYWNFNCEEEVIDVLEVIGE